MSKKTNRVTVFLSTVILLMFFAKCTFAQDQDRLTNNSKAIEVFKLNLAIIDTVTSLELLAKTEIRGSKREEALDFLERLTQIKSTAEYTYTGRFKVPRKDYNKWKAWFEKNKEKLKWNNERQKVEVQEH